MLPLSICEIKFWGNSNYEVLQLKTLAVLSSFLIFELAVVLKLIQARTFYTEFGTSAQIRPFSASLNTKNDSRFHSGNFSKGKTILLCGGEL